MKWLLLLRAVQKLDRRRVLVRCMLNQIFASSTRGYAMNRSIDTSCHKCGDQAIKTACQMRKRQQKLLLLQHLLLRRKAECSASERKVKRIKMQLRVYPVPSQLLTTG